VRYVALALIIAPALAAGTIISDLVDRLLTTQLVVHLNNDKQRVTVRLTSVDARDGGTTWRGETIETGEPAMLMGWSDGRSSGMFAYRGRVYTFQKPTGAGDKVRAVAELDPERIAAQHEAMLAEAPQKEISLVSRSVTALLQRRVRTVEDRQYAGQDDAAADAGPLAAQQIAVLSPMQRQQLAAKKTIIDVMVLYTKMAAANYVDIEADLIAHAIEEANASFRNSGIGNIALNLTHTQAIDYTETERDHFNHLYRMVDGVGPFGKAHTLRNEKRADVVILIVDDASGCGLATRVGADAEEAFAVVHHTCAALMYSIPHEIGHIIGARHDAAVDQTSSAYGHGYVNGTKWRDIMSYGAGCNGCPRLPVWSNPTIKVKGEPAGTLLADNARLLLEQAERVASFR
jgi:Metallo-peptidase family M12